MRRTPNSDGLRGVVFLHIHAKCRIMIIWHAILGVECVGSDRDADLMSRLPHSIMNLRVTMVRVAHQMNTARKVAIRFLMNRGADAFFTDPQTRSPHARG